MAVNIYDLDMEAVRNHYFVREQAHRRGRELFEAGDVTGFVNLALGITEDAGNYSAAEHGVGPRILSASPSAARDVFALATTIWGCPNTNHLPTIIYRPAINYLKISIGSEIAMMLKPDCHWVGNKRTIWSHLLVFHQMDQRRANEALRLYYARDDDSEMDYEVWRDLYLRVGPDLLALGAMATAAAENQGVQPGALRYMWPDAVATFLFDKYARRRPLKARRS